jgi:SAM-dependent methyltransferase
MKHVGGHEGKTWIDYGALKALVDRFQNAKTFIDIGCGPGKQVEVAKALGLSAIGVDGDPEMTKLKHVNLFDFSKKKAAKDDLPFLPKRKYFDIGWSTEFLEHIDEKYIENFMPLFALCKVVVITHATPGQKGHHHVNEQLFPYWKDIFHSYGLNEDKELTKLLRIKSTMKQKKINHFVKYKKDGTPKVKRIKSSFMVKSGRVFINTKLKEL